MRINARVDQETMTQVQYLAKTMGLSISAMIKEIIHLFYKQKRSQEPNAFKILKKTGFIGSGKGEKDLSVNYKKILYESLSKKHGYS